MNAPDRARLTEEMVRLADGDRTAFDPIFSRCWPLVHGFASRMIGRDQQAEDVAQQALMKVFARASEFRADGDALSWILGITAYECRTHRQKVKRRKEDFAKEGPPETRDESPTAEDILVQNSLESAVRELLAELSNQERETILIAINDLERPDVGAATFRKRLQRSLDKLRQKWSDRHE